MSEIILGIILLAIIEAWFSPVRDIIYTWKTGRKFEDDE